MDKDGEHVTAFGALGFGSVEIGTVTPKGQPGNPKPRLFRLIPDEAIINRMGFNNVGAIQVAKNLQSARAFRNRGGILGINIGKNKVTPNSEALSDYKKCMDRLYTSGDYIAINISSPNTPNLRDLQADAELDKLLLGIAEHRQRLADENDGKIVPIAVKIAPDLSDDGVKHALDIIVKHGMNGVICTNTTISREPVEHSPLAKETGGLVRQTSDGSFYRSHPNGLRASPGCAADHCFRRHHECSGRRRENGSRCFYRSALHRFHLQRSGTDRGLLRSHRSVA